MSDFGTFVAILMTAVFAVVGLNCLSRRREESGIRRRVAILEQAVFALPGKPVPTEPKAEPAKPVRKPRTRKSAQ